MKTNKNAINPSDISLELNSKELEVLLAIKKCTYGQPCKKCSSCRGCRSCGIHQSDHNPLINQT